MIEFHYTTWSDLPPSATKMQDGLIRVSRNVKNCTDGDGIVYYAGESAEMTDVQYAAYIGAQEAVLRRENEVIDEYTMELIEKGIIA